MFDPTRIAWRASAEAQSLRDVVFLDELPRNSTGKILTRDLAER